MEAYGICYFYWLGSAASLLYVSYTCIYLDSAVRHGVPWRMTIYNMREWESASCCLVFVLHICFLQSVRVGSFKPYTFTAKSLFHLNVCLFCNYYARAHGPDKIFPLLFFLCVILMV